METESDFSLLIPVLRWHNTLYSKLRNNHVVAWNHPNATSSQMHHLHFPTPQHLLQFYEWLYQHTFSYKIYHEQSKKVIHFQKRQQQCLHECITFFSSFFHWFRISSYTSRIGSNSNWIRMRSGKCIVISQVYVWQF